jgi:hypothetical protein
LARPQFRGSVADFQEAFLAKMAHAGPLSPEQQVRLFTGGLPEPIRVDVELQAPKTSNMPWPMPGRRSSEPQPSQLSQRVDARSSIQPVFSIPRVHPRAWLHPLPQTLRCYC